MRFLIKLIVIGFVALAVLPAFAPEKYREGADTGKGEAQVPSPFQLMALVSQAASDLGNICTRQPAMCETGSEVIGYAGSKARQGLEIAYAMFRHGHPLMQRSSEDPADPATAAD